MLLGNDGMSQQLIEDCVRASLDRLLPGPGREPTRTACTTCWCACGRKPLLEVVMSQADNNQSRAPNGWA